MYHTGYHLLSMTYTYRDYEVSTSVMMAAGVFCRCNKGCGQGTVSLVDRDCSVCLPQVLEDVSEEHARKTITVEQHPHLAVSAASIHPCRHAEVMKKLVDNLIAGGTEFKLEQYLVLFLKFIASVVPTIQYDYTMSVGGQ
eukprot:GHUV01025412.1.p1 GENE.GHUV01025412.1~~GHUV01025412.1.p1  ORF type:complete len:140 (+),score=33.26 GHUV01025412.1:520-939(+)